MDYGNVYYLFMYLRWESVAFSKLSLEWRPDKMEHFAANWNIHVYETDVCVSIANIVLHWDWDCNEISLDLVVLFVWEIWIGFS